MIFMATLDHLLAMALTTSQNDCILIEKFLKSILH